MTIRRQPSDFIVEEILGPIPVPGDGDPHPIVVYRLTKQSLTTPEATQRLARSLGVPPGHVEHAGLKDKHAQTVQHVSVRVNKGSGHAPPSTLIGPGWSAEVLGPRTRPLRAADILANRFTIVVRDLSAGASTEMDRRAAFLSAHAIKNTLVMVNYFGDQRFGSARHGQGFAATHLIAGEFDLALKLLIATPARKDSGVRRTFTRLCAAHWGDWSRLAAELPRCPDRRPIETLAAGGHAREAFAALPYSTQQLAVEAFQSHLWNALATRLIEGLPGTGGPSGVVRTDDPFGPMVFPAPSKIPELWLDLQLPMFAPETLLQEPWREAAEAILTEHGLSLERLRIPGLRRPAFGDASRPLFARATGFSMSPPEPDELATGGPGRVRLKRTLRFDLPRGAYATVLLRALGQ